MKNEAEVNQMSTEVDINFNRMKEEIIHQLGESKIMVLATASNNRVTARSVSCVFDELRILFQTDSIFTKAKQIKENPYVALCYDNIQIEGMAFLKGHPCDESNRAFIDKYKKYYTSSFKLYSGIKTEVVIEVQPSIITLWKYEYGKPFQDILLVQKKKAYRKLYSHNTVKNDT